MPILDKLYTLKNAREQLEESAQVIQAKSRDDVGMIVAAWEDPRTATGASVSTREGSTATVPRL